MAKGATGSANDVERRKIPAAQSRYRSRVVIVSALAVAAVLLFVPALLVRPMRNAGVLGFTLGAAIAFGLDYLPYLSSARGKVRLVSWSSRYLTAPTWTGMRTIDLRDLRSVRARLVTGRGGSAKYLVVTDRAGVRMTFTEKQDIERIRRAVEWHSVRKNARQVTVSPYAASVLGLEPLHIWRGVLWFFGSFVPLLLAILAIGGAITALAA